MLPLARPRPPTPGERALLEALAGDVLAPQVAAAAVVAECSCGCPSIGLATDAPALPGAHGHRELSRTVLAGDGRTVEVILHVVDGVVQELEVWAGHDGGDPSVPLPLVDAPGE
jgi:hypothetical protein